MVSPEGKSIIDRAKRLYADRLQLELERDREGQIGDGLRGSVIEVSRAAKVLLSGARADGRSCRRLARRPKLR